ncbi:MAG: vanadium-dependent haloperoxidase [Hoeflea sp.]|uniref:vanadium-dependent haloperoxidase n=1 Tax=Hoeflea sp. TaxID=1940281 RepID=UPI003EF34FEC
MTDDLKPVPNGEVRLMMAKRIRDEATSLATRRVPAVKQLSNGDASAALKGADSVSVAAHGTFTKGLKHDMYGRVVRQDLRTLVSAINQDGNGTEYASSPFPGTYKGALAGKPAAFDVPLYDGTYKRPEGGDGKARSWESPIAGHTFDLEGPDADQTAMPPAPKLGSSELTGEIAEVYGAALIRDVPFTSWDTDAKVAEVVDYLNALPFFASENGLDADAKKRRAARFGDGDRTVTIGNLFRGSTKGAQTGPYISQFMLVGNSEKASADPGYSNQTKTGSSLDALTRSTSHVPPEMRSNPGMPACEDEGFIRYGTQAITQKLRPHQEKIDHMTEWQTWLDVQNGANRKDKFDFYLTDSREPVGDAQSRFIATPRDLATYVHFDQLYQAYLNACLLILGKGMTSDAGLPEGMGHPTRDGFATFGGPHILTLVNEVATRALKAVRRQKYNVHLRSRPEAVAAAIGLAWSNNAADKNKLGPQKALLDGMVAPLSDAGLLDAIAAHNYEVNLFWKNNNWPVEYGPLENSERNALLPMAFPEGSPMHPAYGAGHATVAGACVTILKAFFEMYEIGEKRNTFSIYDIVTMQGGYPAQKFPDDLFGNERLLVGEREDQFEHAYVPDPVKSHTELHKHTVLGGGLTIQGELDKLAANIAIGRNFAGVHFYTDYYESLRAGERIAVGILQEQMLTYREPVSMRFTSFDDDYVMIVGTGGSNDQDDAVVLVWDKDKRGGTEADFQKWWTRHQP